MAKVLLFLKYNLSIFRFKKISISLNVLHIFLHETRRYLFTFIKSKNHSQKAFHKIPCNMKNTLYLLFLRMLAEMFCLFFKKDIHNLVKSSMS